MADSPAFGKVQAPEFPAGIAWVNTGRDLSMADLRGRLTILHFWTYA